MAKKTSLPSTASVEEIEPMASSNIIGADDGSEFLFTYDTNVDEAKAPEPLPVGNYIAEITDIRPGTDNFSGQPNFQLRMVVDPSHYPADYSPENAPDGVTVVFFSPAVGNDRKGMWNMKVIAEKLRIPGTNRFKREDFVGKQVNVELDHREGQDGVLINRVKGTPQAV
jgi:hypothetical protein